MTEYPILTADFGKEEARTLACPRCDATREATDDEVGMTDGLGPCQRCYVQGSGERMAFLEWKYAPADECEGCGSLGFYDRNVNDGCCSRACMLQAEHIRNLEAQRRAA